jgi:hypothetical protein
MNKRERVPSSCKKAIKKGKRDVERSIWIVNELHTVYRWRKGLYILQGL